MLSGYWTFIILGVTITRSPPKIYFLNIVEKVWKQSYRRLDNEHVKLRKKMKMNIII